MSSSTTALAGAIGLVLAISPGTGAAQEPSSVPLLIEGMKQLEGARDPKCYATANRLEDFMYGTPLDAGARFAKVELQKRWLLDLWQRASAAARPTGGAAIDAATLEPVLKAMVSVLQTPQGDWVVAAAGAAPATVEARDKRQYGAVAYALRALLAVQQDALLRPDLELVPLTPEAVAPIQDALDLLTLAALQRADRAARLAGRREIDQALFARSWQETLGAAQPAPAPEPPPPAAPARFATLHAVVAQKLAAYEAYNQIAMPVFLRNLQVYFARHRWPADPREGEAFRSYFNEANIAFVRDVLTESERRARAAQHGMIRLADVDGALQSFLPHRLNEYEDCIYFPRLPRGERVTIEAYDLDSFRDGGLHWFYLQQAIAEPGYGGALEPDPFAAELLVEGAAQFGTLVLRLAGTVAREVGDPRLETSHLEASLRRIQSLIDRHAAAPAEAAEAPPLPSSAEPAAAASGKYFTEVTAASGLVFEHRMADWLARLIRSYVQERDGVAKLAVPQAFGGSGIAAEDLDGDGDIDLLALSGSGNALFANDGRGRLADVTAGSGLAWVRPDGRPGEPRQPIVADFDNDGLQDILITYANDDHRLYRNLGSLRFADVTAQAGLGGAGSVGGPATAFDFDQDGLLDVFIGYFGDYIHGVLPTLARRNNNGLPDRLFRNQGGFRFADVTAASGLTDSGWTQAAGHTDFDRDGRQDLIVGNDFGANAYYRNLGGGRFEEVSAQLGTDKPSFTMNIGLTDLNRDGFPDVYISNIVTMNKDEKYVLPDETTPMKVDPAKLATMRIVEANDLFTSVAENGRLKGYRLSDAVDRSGVAATGWAWDADFFDFDNDGDDDLYCVNGMNEYAVYSSYNPYFTDPSGKPLDVVIPVADKETHVFLVNRGGRLENESGESGADLLGNSRSVAYFDADSDGDLDIALNNFQSPAVFLRNESQGRGNHWLKIRLVGDPEKGVTRDAIGARIEVETARHKGLSREVLSTTGYLSVHPKEQHLGLGRDTRARVTVLWPNGERNVFDGLAADRGYTIVQGKGIAGSAAVAARP